MPSVASGLRVAAALAALGCSTPSMVYVRDAGSSDSGGVDVGGNSDALVVDSVVDAAADVGAIDVVSDVADDRSPGVDVATDAAADVPDAGVDAACGSGLTRCSGGCVDPSNDSAHCGGCGTICGSSDVCVAGRCGAPRVNALHPPIVDGASGSIVIEGAFGPTATVTFPGVATPSPATRLGPSRLQVDVPPGTTAGDLTVRTAGVTASSVLRVRRASFTLGLQPFRTRYEQADYARQTPSLATARVHPAWINTGTWLYLLGGASASGMEQGSVERAMINADGTLGAFQDVSPALATPREGATAVRVGDTVYLIGGQNRGVSVASIERATVDSAGVLSAFAPSALRLITARSGHVAEIIGGYVYVFGGDTDAVERAPVRSDGTLGEFATLSGVTTRARRRRAAAQVVGGYVYLLGGSSGTAALDSIERAAIDPTGDRLANFESSGRLSSTRAGAASLVLGNALYVAGGTDGTTTRTSVERAEISADANLRPFSVVTGRALSLGRHGAASTVIGNHWYLVGGANVDPLRGIDRAELNDSGDLRNARAVGGPVEPRANATAVAIGPYVYLVGGGGDGGVDRHIERALVARDGSVGPFARVDPPMGGEFTAEAPAVAVIGSALHVIAGRTGGTGGPHSYLGTMRSFPILDDGSLGAGTSPQPALLDVAWSRPLVFDDRLCIFGGGSSSSARSDVTYCAPIRAGGGLDAFAALGTRLPRALGHLMGAVIGDQIILLGGTNGTTTERTVMRCPLTTSALNCDVVTGQLARNRAGINGLVVGGRLVAVGGFNPGPTYWNDLERASVTGATIPGPFALIDGLSLPSPLAGNGGLVIDNSAWLFGGLTGATLAPTNTRIDLR